MKAQRRHPSKRQRPIIAIDGPVGAGKSVAARGLAQELGFRYLNTGAMYRAVALAARAARISPALPDLERTLAPLLESIDMVFDKERLLLNGRDVTASLAEPEIGELASRFSTLPAVRARMREVQRAAGARGGLVMEGRDIGTVIFPDAEFKFFLDADVKVRAKRRFAELTEKGVKTDLESVLAQLLERDRRDASRALAPLRRSPDAIAIDSTNLTVDQVVAALKAHVQRGLTEQGLKHD